MIDMIKLSVPFMDDYTTILESGYMELDMNRLMRDFGMSLEGSIRYDNGKPVHERLRHKFESLPSHFASLAYKVCRDDLRGWPYIAIQGNPAKLLTGHNVYGSDNPELCTFSVTEAFCQAFPEIIEALDWERSTVDFIDITYTARLGNDLKAQQAINVLKNLNYGQMKVSECAYESTVYWNKGSQHLVRKAYLKAPEINRRVAELTRKLAKERHDHYAHQINAITSDEVQDMAQGAIRFEVRLFAKWLKKHGCNTTVRYFTTLTQHKITELWQLAFQPVFKCFEGATVNAQDHSAVLNNLRTAHHRITNSGNISYSKAERLYDFYLAIVRDGYVTTKARICERSRETFRRNQQLLIDAGLSLAQLMQFTGEQTNVIPLIQLITIDFSKQLPDSWQEPKSLYEQAKTRPALKLAS
jgi:II/X family phage/plasmid replication protein